MVWGAVTGIDSSALTMAIEAFQKGLALESRPRVFDSVSGLPTALELMAIRAFVVTDLAHFPTSGFTPIDSATKDCGSPDGSRLAKSESVR